ncbi:MAG: hypothetical protein U0232_14660 [Thermomicrobiales bacterium]
MRGFVALVSGCIRGTVRNRSSASPSWPISSGGCAPPSPRATSGYRAIARRFSISTAGWRRFYRKVYLRGRRRTLESAIRTEHTALAGHNPKTVRYLSEGWRHQRDRHAGELRELEATATLDPPPWPQILARFRSSLGEARAEKGEG